MGVKNIQGELRVNNNVVATQDWVAEQLDQSSGIIEGDLAIQGNLTVAGETTTLDTVTLQVQDNVVVTNSDGEELIDVGGFAIKTDSTNAYGIMYDPVGDGVKIGLGEFDSDGKFTYIDGEDQFIATRADTIADGHTVIWDDDAKQFVDSGTDHSEYLKATNVAQVQGTTIDNGTLSIYPANRDAIDKKASYRQPIVPAYGDYFVKQSIITNTETWTDDDKSKARSLFGAVGTTDYLTTSTAGSIKADDAAAFLAYNGRPYAKSLTETQYKNASGGAFIGKATLENIKYTYVQQALIDYTVGDGETSIWTEEAKAKACETIGAVTAITSKASAVRAYIIKTDGTQGTYNVATTPMLANNYAIALYLPEAVGANEPQSWLTTKTPTQSYHSANKDYVDNGFVAKSTLVPNEATPWSIPQRTYNGRVIVGTPEENSDATTKKYVDDLVASVQGGSGGSAKLYKHVLNNDEFEMDSIYLNEGCTLEFVIVSSRSEAYRNMYELQKDYIRGANVMCYVHNPGDYGGQSMLIEVLTAIDGLCMLVFGSEMVVAFTLDENGAITDTVEELQEV